MLPATCWPRSSPISPQRVRTIAQAGQRECRGVWRHFAIAGGVLASAGLNIVFTGPSLQTAEVLPKFDKSGPIEPSHLEKRWQVA